MSDNQNFRDYGQQFKYEIEQALDSGDFSGLNQLVSDTVGMAVSGAADQMNRAADRISKEMGQAYRENKAEQTAAERARQEEMHRASREELHRQRRRASDEHLSKYDFRTPRTAPKQSERAVREQISPDGMQTPAVSKSKLLRKNGSVSGTLCQIFGGIGIGLCGSATFVFLILYIMMQFGPLLALAILFFVMTAGSLFLLGSGTKIKARLVRAQRYFELCEKSGYMNVSQIAELIGRKEKEVVRELRQLIANGTFPQGHLDREQKCFMLTDSTYEEYRRVELQRQQYPVENTSSAQEKAAEKPDAAKGGAQQELTPQQRQLAEMIEEGQAYIRQIREKNDAIPGEVITEKLFRMESLLKEIFSNLEKMPEQMPKMQRLMHYYLPTTLKLVTAYEQFDHVSVQGEDIADAKKEIENTIDTINGAFGELLNKLFADTAMDVTTDAQVLKTMLAKEGLVEGELDYVR